MSRRLGSLDSCPPWCEAGHRGVLHAPHGREIGDVKDGRAGVHISLVWDPHGSRIFREPVVMLRAYGPDELLAGHARPLLLMDAGDAGHVGALLALLGHAGLAELVRQAGALLAGEATR
jgi:hypothetical protein